MHVFTFIKAYDSPFADFCVVLFPISHGLFKQEIKQGVEDGWENFCLINGVGNVDGVVR